MIINKNNLNVCLAASNDQYRGNLNAVFFDKDGTVATDGHILMKVSYPDIKDKEYPVFEGLKEDKEKIKPFLLPKASVVDLMRSLQKNKDKPILNQTAKLAVDKTNKNGNAFFGITNLETSQVKTIRKVDEEFPNYKRVLWEKKEKTFEIAVDPRLMIDVLSQFTAMGIRGIRLSFKTNEHPIMFSGNLDGQEALGVLMPMEIDEREKSKNETKEKETEEPYGSYEPEEGKGENGQKADKNTPKTSEKEKPVGLSTGRETTLKNKEKTTQKDKNTSKTAKNVSKKDTKFTLTNSFHKTQIMVNKSFEELEKIVAEIRKGKACLGHKVYVAKIRKALCGVKGCTHCDELGRKK